MKISGVENCDAYSVNGVDEPDISTISETALATCPVYVAPTVDPAHTDPTIDSDTPATVTIQDGRRNYTWSVSGTRASIIPNGESIYPSATVHYDFDCCAVIITDITVTVTDEYNNEVEYVIENIEPVVPEPTIDVAATDDTIDNATPATVTIKDGCPPYTWSVSGTGYSIDPSGSSALLSATVSVAAGTCGVNYGVTCTVTVTDACGNSVNKVIRNTSGTGWVTHGSCLASCTGGSTCSDMAECYTPIGGSKEVIEGDNRWLYTASITCIYNGRTCVWYKLPSGACTEPNPSVCSSPVTCAQYAGVSCSCIGTAGACYMGSFGHYIWGCL